MELSRSKNNHPILPFWITESPGLAGQHSVSFTENGCAYSSTPSAVNRAGLKAAVSTESILTPLHYHTYFEWLRALLGASDDAAVKPIVREGVLIMHATPCLALLDKPIGAVAMST